MSSNSAAPGWGQATGGSFIHRAVNPDSKASSSIPSRQFQASLRSSDESDRDRFVSTSQGFLLACLVASFFFLRTWLTTYFIKKKIVTTTPLRESPRRTQGYKTIKKMATTASKLN